MTKVLLTGAHGMLATDFIRSSSERFEILAYDRASLDITDIEAVDRILSSTLPDIVVNAAAYTAVDLAETTGRYDNYAINTLGVYNLAKITAKYGIDLMTISTDYVFDGEKKEGYVESDICRPINAYGMSKYLGEELAQSENPDTIIIRTSWLYGGGSGFRNFVNTMITLAETKTELRIVDDQYGSPTSTESLSLALADIIDERARYRSQILHLSDITPGNGITWYDFAREIFRLTQRDIRLIPCSSSDFVTLAKRPTYSKLQNTSDIEMRDWKESLREYIDTL